MARTSTTNLARATRSIRTTTTTRTWMSASELPVQARARLEHAGRWVALSEDFNTVVAVGDGAVRFRTELEAAGARVPADGAQAHVVSALHVCRLAKEVPPMAP